MEKLLRSIKFRWIKFVKFIKFIEDEKRKCQDRFIFAKF